MSGLERLVGRRILFLNWRDVTNPAAGGAETYAEEIAGRFARAGAKVTLFTSRYQGARRHDWDNGYLVIRGGGRFGVYFAAWRHLKQCRLDYDAIVDCQNGIPFFSPIWAAKRTAVICVVHHVHQKQFDLYFRWPANRLARLLERRISRRVYRGRPLVAVSPSTRAGMYRELGFREQVHIVPNGIEWPPASSAPRSPTPFIAVVTRLVPHKRLNLLVEAIPELLPRWPDLRVEIAGAGPALSSLRARISALGLEAVVSLPGRISEQQKSDVLSMAWVTVAPSLGEGWGLTVIEANASGTPAVAFDVPGLRDSVRDGRTGWLVPAGEGLADGLSKALAALSVPDYRKEMARQCRQWAGRFSWEASASRLAEVLLSEIGRRQLGIQSRRSPVPLAAIASWPPTVAAETEELLRKALRLTDVIVRSGEGLTVMLHGCDELGAASALRRASAEPAQLRLATTTEVLCGLSEENLR
jgi:glycosyltransferase involved in cell wall biosynthesis